MAGRSRRVLALLAAVAALVLPARLRAQGPEVARGLEAEQAGRMPEAAAAYRQAIGGAGTVAAVLGLERVYTAIGTPDSLLPLLDTLIREQPGQRIFRSVQLRTLHALGRDAAAHQAFEQWVAVNPDDPAPYREFAQLLLDAGQPAAADSVLHRGRRAVGDTQGFSLETAQMRAAMGMWAPAAQAWREVLAASPFLEQAAVYALAATPSRARDSVRTALMAPPVTAAARRLLASLESSWGSPREGWRALRDLPPSPEAVKAWSDFALRAEGDEAWLAARDALSAVLRASPSPAVALRAANDALRGGDAAGALQLASIASSGADSAAVARQVVPLRLRALSVLGRAPEAQQTLDAYARFIPEDERPALTRAVAWAWVRTGDVPKARAALAMLGPDVRDSSAAAGWLALYDGRLATARVLLRQADDASPDQVAALALLARTTADSSSDLGAGFLALARGDSAGAAHAFERAATVLTDAAPLLLTTAAQLYAGLRDDGHAIALWQGVVERDADAPEAPEAELDWARALLRKGDAPGAVARLEHLILTYPESALVPQARHELDVARRGIPGSS